MGNYSKASSMWFWVDERYFSDFIKNYNEESDEGYFLIVWTQRVKGGGGG